MVKSFTVDLTKIKGKGDFRCPKCGAYISPDDTSEDTYTILEPIVKGSHLEEIALQCKKCRSKIRLTGFQVLNTTRIIIA
jgi:DNA-directed RNA polymerase subunit RPC12/RpoP